MKTIKLLLCCLPWVAAAAHAAGGLEKGEWWIQLTVASKEAGGMKDASNYLGWYRDSRDGKDNRDLIEPAPFASPYLTIVFPHADWGADAGDYTADFRSVKGGRRTNDEWNFEVRTDQPGREVTLSWNGDGLNKQLDQMRLVDVPSGKTMTLTGSGAVQTYTLKMPGTIHRFKWIRQ